MAQHETSTWRNVAQRLQATFVELHTKLRSLTKHLDYYTEEY